LTVHPLPLLANCRTSQHEVSATAIEYGLIPALISVVIIGAIIMAMAAAAMVQLASQASLAQRRLRSPPAAIVHLRLLG
jgi:Flp pilus assembly pilin Flp